MWFAELCAISGLFFTGSEISDVVNCRNGVVVERFKVGDFWQGFESIKGA